MNLGELYSQTSVDRHKHIKVVGDRVFVKGINGSVDEYLLDEEQKLWLIRSDKEQKQDIKAIMSKLGIKETLQSS